MLGFSGIPTFRDAQTGLWTEHDAVSLASPEGFRADPALVWGWYEWRRMKVLGAKPNPGHLAIAELAERVPRLTLVTQSIGTSSMVWPAAQLPETAARQGAIIVQINPEPTALDRTARFNLRGKAGDILPALLEAL
jgi:NAD-dependent SIR2 family protein deacetylase